MDYSVHSRKLDEIEHELRRLKFLIGEVTVARPVTSAFGLRDMPFENWLAYVFLPRAREAIATRNLPGSSSVGIVAMRNLEGDPALRVRPPHIALDLAGQAARSFKDCPPMAQRPAVNWRVHGTYLNP